MKKVVVIGANGQLGSDICRIFLSDYLSMFSVYKITRKDLDISDFKKTNEILDEINPDIIINTAAYHKVDDVEDNPQLAFLINGSAVLNMSKYCKETDKTLVWFSTDYVFGLDKDRQIPYREPDSPSPINVYGVSKLAGENFIRYTNPKYYIVRTGELFGVTGASGKGGNFVETMLRLAREKKPIKVVEDQVVSPTYTLNLATQVVSLLTTGKYGLYHATSEGGCSWYEFAKEIFTQVNLKVSVEPVTSAQYPTRVIRPKYSVLENFNLKKIGLNQMLNWEEALRLYLEDRKK